MSCIDILDDKATLDTPTFYTNQTASKNPYLSIPSTLGYGIEDQLIPGRQSGNSNHGKD
jgi:hypothetical protein